uniref:Unkown protein n=1 Tax=Riptortus pedestris TaxID=329032 RepID=R4WQ82_RIPPE|nr:unkown protein [Riptortus pedestris]
MAEEDETAGEALLKKLPRINRFCFVTGVDLGSLFIGFVGLVVAKVFFIIDVLDLAFIGDRAAKEPGNSILTTALGIIIFDALIQIGYIVISVYLILGIKKKRRLYIKAYILASIGLTFSKGAAAIAFLAFREVVPFITCFIYASFQVYYTLVVNSHYLETNIDVADY